MFCRKIFLKVVGVFSIFHNYLLLEKSMTLHLNKLKSPLPKDALVEVGQVVLQENNVKYIFSLVFS